MNYKTLHFADTQCPRLASVPCLAGQRLQYNIVNRGIQRTARQQNTCVASLGRGPAYNKYRSRQDIERDYFKDWERTTLLAEEELKRPMTALTFLAFLPTWFKFYVIPGPIRYVWYLIWQRIKKVAAHINMKAVYAGAKLDVALIKRQGSSSNATFDRKLVMMRLHGKLSIWQNLMYRFKLLRGETPGKM